MDQLQRVLFTEVPTIRINRAYTEPTMAADLFEANQQKSAAQASAMSQPSPAAAPFTAAITGFGKPCKRATLLWVCP